MRLHPFLLLSIPLALAPLPSAAGAQERERERSVRVLAPSVAPRIFELGERSPRAVLGITTTTTGSARDTLGLLVSQVHPGGPAERAGIEEGNRIMSVNGVNLRVAAADADDHEGSALLSRRLTRELGKLEPGDAAELRIHAGGQQRTVRVTTADADSLYRRMRTAVRMQDDDRAAIGIGLGSAGSMRDTLGVLVMSVVDTGPAARAGVEEGNRIASINGVDLRVSREDRGDAVASRLKASRLQREIARLKAGDQVELRLYVGNGQFRNVRLQAVKASELGRARSTTFFSPGAAPATMRAFRTPGAPLLYSHPHARF